MISAKADHRHTDYFFQREQSRGLKQLEWDRPTQIITPWRIAGVVAALLLALIAVVM